MTHSEQDRLDAMAEWVEQARTFLSAHPPGAEIAPADLEALLERRDALVTRIQAGGPLRRHEAEAALRLQILEEELQRRVQRDLERRRAELEELDKGMGQLQGYREEIKPAAPSDSRYIDTRS